jgi:hypothetical protein
VTAAAIIRQANAEGVTLALSPAGALKVAGDQAVVNRWLPIIREQKPGIVKALLEADACTGDLEAIRAWLAFIGETDPATIVEVIGQCQRDVDARDYFTRRAAAELNLKGGK